MTDIQSILDKSDGGRLIYAALLGDQFCINDPESRKYINPCYDDRNPSFSVYWSDKSEKWLHYDHGDNSFKGDVFSLISSNYNLDLKADFPAILKKAQLLLASKETPANPFDMGNGSNVLTVRE
jgi:hypothetical protein